MEGVKEQLEKIEDLLAQLDEIIVSAKGILPGKIRVDKAEVFGVIDEIRGIVYELTSKGLPAEIHHARRVVNDRDNIVSDAQHRAKMILESAEKEAATILSDHDIVHQAKEAAAKLTKESQDHIAATEKSVSEGIAGMADDLIHTLQATYNAQVKQAREAEEFNSKAEKFYLELLDDIREYRASIRKN